MQLFDGNYHAHLLEQKIIDHLKINPNLKDGVLAIIQIGKNDASKKYVNLKKSFCDRLGLKAEVLTIDANKGTSNILDEISAIFTRDNVRGGIIQLPLPREDLRPVLDLIPFEKDVDNLSQNSSDRFYKGDFTRLSPVIRAFDYFCNACGTDYVSTRVTIIGEGSLVGKPIAWFLEKNGASVTIMNNYKKGETIDADLVVLSVGIPNLVNGADISSDANVVDFGSSVVEGKTIGDLNLSSKIDHLNFISPSPGGMGPLVVRFLIMNFLGV
jgi:methylenetetrahydrofolate dehydrogenase (NADP+) / methenyltetrahydrofolate cyclohydrolase